MRRPLWETLAEVLGAVSSAEEAGIRVTSLLLELPVELQLRRSPGSTELLACLPRWRWTTVFDPPSSRLRLHSEEYRLPSDDERAFAERLAAGTAEGEASVPPGREGDGA